LKADWQDHDYMQHPSVYELSKKYGPPTIDLRTARIRDDYGDESSATRPIKHRVPEDATKEDFDFYQDVFAFMEFADLLFYLYPIALEFERNAELNCIDSFMYSLDQFVPRESSKLPPSEQESLKDGLVWIWDAAPPRYADWGHCRNLQAAIGLR
jgi:hypothetical protein